MTRAVLLAILLPGALLARPDASLAQAARLANARLESRDASSGLERAFGQVTAAQRGPAWVGWTVATTGEHHMCCYGSTADIEASPCAGRCFLEDDSRNITLVQADGGDCLVRGGSDQMVVLIRIAARVPERLRTFSSDCTLDAGGLAVYWLTGVRPSDSVAFLQTFIGNPALEGRKHWKNGEPALAAIAMHDDPAADTVLERASSPSSPESVRKKAIFWLGNARGRRGYEVLRILSRTEESEAVRRHLTFALSQSNVPEAADTLLEMAKRDSSSGVRGQALFWLAQKAGKKAAGAIRDSLRNDPETEVKRKAVFALTQMPRDEGIPLLIEVARTNRNPEVQKQAIFWLGQSKDPRALAFIEEVLTK